MRLAAADGATIAARRIWVDEAEAHVVLPAAARPAFVEVDPRGWTPGTVKILYGREDALAALAHGSTAVVRRRAIAALAEMRGDQGVAEALAARGAIDHWSVAHDAITAIANLDLEGTTALLLAFERHPAPRARAALAKALGDRPPDKAAAAAAERLLDDPAYRVVAAAARAYPTFATGPAAVKRLARVAAKDSPWQVVASAALAAVGQIGGKDALDSAAARIGAKEPARVCAAALEAVGKAAHGRLELAIAARRALGPALEDRAVVIRLGAIAGLEQVGDPQSLDLLRKRLSRESSEDVRTHAKSAAEALRALQHDAARIAHFEERIDALDQDHHAASDALERVQRRLGALESAP